MDLTDPRARRTRDKLRTAILDLATERELGSITVTEVARRAAVNRATVYQHYPDVDALIAEAMEETVARAVRSAALCPLEAPPEPAPRPLLDLFEHVAANAVLYRRMLSADGSARLAHRMRDRLRSELAARFRHETRPAGCRDVPPDLHAAYLAGALTGVITAWISAGTPAPPADTALATWRLFRSG